MLANPSYLMIEGMPPVADILSSQRAVPRSEQLRRQLNSRLHHEWI